MAELAVKGDAYTLPHGPQPGAAHACLRVLLFASTLALVVVAVTSKQTVSVTVAGIPFPVPLLAKFTQSPVFIYFVAAMSVACLYSLITALAAITFVVKKPVSRARSLLFLLIWDAVMLELVASATGTAGGVGYIAWKGNTQVSCFLSSSLSQPTPSMAASPNKTESPQLFVIMSTKIPFL
ncbi:hypothetical protein MLD38_019797 [Melastoma candidum]|uniref:Uncharacterized protein n=1 Tax=Melastoma candidum TaxID=119954 RepID=A0ACB9QB79_9MYRT|nr:hypothetical protein MLD38_019797 [Melastoma candidum]